MLPKLGTLDQGPAANVFGAEVFTLASLHMQLSQSDVAHW